jgi:hypothetical protein
MAIYQITDSKLEKIMPTTFAEQGIKERDDIQRLLRNQIEVIAPGVLILAEEFGEWADSRHRIDLLGIDKKANLVVIELKRTTDGGYMDLQAIRYAAMISTMTFSRVLDIYSKYFDSTGNDEDAETALLEFLEWDSVQEDKFAQEVKIVLASAEFSKELTTSVIWLNNNGLDIKCIRLKPYKDAGKVYLDVQQVIPLPEAEEYQVRFRNKSQKAKESRTQNRDLTKYDITLDDTIMERLPKRQAIFHIVKYLCDSGVAPEEIWELIPWKRNVLFKSFEGKLDSEAFEKALGDQMEANGKNRQPWRHFISDDELIYSNGRTYAFHKMWGNATAKALGILSEHFKDKGISFKESSD